MSINCEYWSALGKGFGLCSKNLYGGRPSYGICNICKDRKPKGCDENIESKMIEKAKENIQNNPTLKTEVTLKDKLHAILPVLSAVTNGKEVSIERQEQRLKICSECDKLSLIDGKPSCGICTCVLKIGDRSVVNLISLEETDKYGCKYYGNGSLDERSKWKKAGV